ncbi:putative 4-hydroxy-4-methyl-2-oxoglutarate aldolase 2 [Capsicum chinense]|nr:putative 4-hydroxy-4-methyl-2-oxoglutarate aldolase 2 [Capsicum chinense]
MLVLRCASVEIERGRPWKNSHKQQVEEIRRSLEEGTNIVRSGVKTIAGPSEIFPIPNISNGPMKEGTAQTNASHKLLLSEMTPTKEWKHLFSTNRIASKGINLSFIPPIIMDGEKVVEISTEDVASKEVKWKATIVLYIVSTTPSMGAMDRFIMPQASQISYGRILVEVDVTQELPTSIKVQDPKGNIYKQQARMANEHASLLGTSYEASVLRPFSNQLISGGGQVGVVWTGAKGCMAKLERGVLHRMALVTTAEVCDANPQLIVSGELRALQPIYKIYGRRQVFSGPVVTLKVFEDNVLVREFLEEKGNGRVLVVDGGGSLRCAILGGNPVVQAQNNGWAGIVVNGCVRDVDEINGCDIGVRALASHPMKANKKGIGEKHVPITIAGTRICDGEWLYADTDGILISKMELSV